MDLRRLFEHYADIERAGQDEKARHGRGRTKREIERERGARRSRGRFHRRTRSSGARYEETEGDMERPATTHANLQIRSVKVRHCGRVGGGLGPSSATEHCFASVVLRHVSNLRRNVVYEAFFKALMKRRVKGWAEEWYEFLMDFGDEWLLWIWDKSLRNCDGTINLILNIRYF